MRPALAALALPKPLAEHYAATNINTLRCCQDQHTVLLPASRSTHTALAPRCGAPQQGSRRHWGDKQGWQLRHVPCP
jgi:hypothetical protein